MSARLSSPRVRVAATSLVAAAVVVLSACGGGSDRDAGPTTTEGRAPTTTAAPTSTTRATPPTTAGHPTPTRVEPTPSPAPGPGRTPTPALTTTTPPEAGGTRDQYVEAARQSLIDGNLGNERQAACVAGRMVDAIGLDRLQRVPASADSFGEQDFYDTIALDPAGATALYDSFGSCGVDLYQEFLKTFERMDPDMRRCLTTAVPAERFRTGIIKGFQGLDVDELNQAYRDCTTPKE